MSELPAALEQQLRTQCHPECSLATLEIARQALVAIYARIKEPLPCPSAGPGGEGQVSVEWPFFGFSVYDDAECVVWHPAHADLVVRFPDGVNKLADMVISCSMRPHENRKEMGQRQSTSLDDLLRTARDALLAARERPEYTEFTLPNCDYMIAELTRALRLPSESGATDQKSDGQNVQ